MCLFICIIHLVNVKTGFEYILNFSAVEKTSQLQEQKVDFFF